MPFRFKPTIKIQIPLRFKLFLYQFLVFVLPYVAWSQNTAIPDVNFEQALIDLGYDTAPTDGFIPTANISSISDLDVSNKNISDLTGIADFNALRKLDCSGNSLSDLDVSNNTALEELYCSNNALTALNVSNLPNLKIFWCAENQLSTLDISQNPLLISLVCHHNLLTALDLTTSLNLSVLDCSYNKIPNLNLANSKNLSLLNCSRNNLTTLNLSNAPKLKELQCNDNKLTDLDTSQNTQLNELSCVFNLIVNLNLSENHALTKVDCSNNLLCTLNLKNGNNSNTIVNFGFNISIVCVIVDDVLDPHDTWTPSNYGNYVSSTTDCNNNIPIVVFDDVVTNQPYVLPNLSTGNYFTGSKGTGTPLYPGDIIQNSQTVYIYNEGACGSNESQFHILIIDDELYIPKFFTPNNDGSHDVWTVRDKADQVFNILIYDRYGKFLKFLYSNSIGWNGTYNGSPLPSSDYWYVINLKSGAVLKGHFTLKR